MSKIIKTGYLFDKRYQSEFQFDQEKGLEERKIFVEKIEKALKDQSGYLNDEVTERGNNLTYRVILDTQEITINFDTINSIVSQNKDRKINGKSYYPFDKNMDKYNSIYVSVITDNINDVSYDFADKVLSNIVSALNKDEDLYEYKSLICNPIEY